MTDLIEQKAKELCALISGIKDKDQKIDALNQVRKMLHEESPLKHHPVDFVEWVKSEVVEINDYNPNHLAPPEERLLLKSISEDGYTMSIVTAKEPDIRRIVDGAQRRKIERKYDKISESTLGYLPVTTIRQSQEGLADRMASTIRHNRARGEHAIEEMIAILRTLKLDCAMSDSWIIKSLGMDPDELLRLSQMSGIVEMFVGKEFSPSWEVGTDESAEDNQ